jgi:hypothetical protein
VISGFLTVRKVLCVGAPVRASLGCAEEQGGEEGLVDIVGEFAGEFAGAMMRLEDGGTVLEDEDVLTGWSAELSGTVFGGVTGGSLEPPGVLLMFVHWLVKHFWYRVIALLPPQLEDGSPGHFMLQFPRIPGLGMARGLRVLPQ